MIRSVAKIVLAPCFTICKNYGTADRSVTSLGSHNLGQKPRHRLTSGATFDGFVRPEINPFP